MAGHLLKANGRLVVWNRTAAKSADLASQGATVAESVAGLARACHRIVMCVGGSDDVRALAAEIAEAASPGALVIDHSTIEPEAAREVAAMLAQKGIRFVDAPITGGSMGAQAGTLTIFLGGTEADTAEAIEVVKPYSKRAERVGPVGAGQMMKLANQIAVGGALLGLCESLAFAEKAGLDLAQTRELLGGGAAGSWAFEFYGPKILNRDWKPGFAVRHQQKDFRYTMAAAAGIHAAVPMTELAHLLLKKLEDEGKGDLTTVALFESLLERNS